MMHFKRLAPLANRVLVRKADPIIKSKGGILLSDPSKGE